MSNKIIIVVLLTLISLTSAEFLRGVGIANGNRYLLGTMIVKFKPEYRGKIETEVVDGIAKTNIPQIDQLNRQWQVYKVEKIISDPNPSELAKQYGMDLFYRFDFPESKDVMRIIKDYEKTGVIQYAEPDYIFQVDRIPNDPYYSSQWHLLKSQCALAWDGILGDSTVTVMIIDCGIDYNHDDLKYVYSINTAEDINNNRRFDPYPASQGGDFDGIDQDGNLYTDDVIGWDWISNDPNPFPNPGDDHGTNCAGIPIAHTDNNVGIASYSWGCRYVDARCGHSGYIYNYLPALYYAVTRQVWAVSMSFGGSVYQQAYQDAINYAWAGGCVLMASAGNCETHPPGVLRYPACYQNVICVAATDQNDYLSDWPGPGQSNYGPFVDVCAPGTAVLTTDPNNGYGAWDGTSMSTPCVAGLAALIKSMYPRMTNAECTLRIFQSCDPMPDPQYAAGNCGYGRINATKAIYQPIRSNLKTIDFRINDGNNNYPQNNETVSLIITLTNERGYQNATNVSAILVTNDPDVTIIKNTANFPNINAGASQNCSADSFVFTVNANAVPHRVRFIIQKNANPPSLSTLDTIYVNICFPRILLVDDDEGANYEIYYKEAIDSLKTFYRLWTVTSAGSPPLETLSNYPVTVWFTGLDSLNTLTTTDINNLTSYLNLGNKLFICGQNLGQHIGSSSFYSNYLRASYVTNSTGILFAIGVPNDPIGGVYGDTVVLGGAGGAGNSRSNDGIRPLSGARGCFWYRGYPDTTIYGAIHYSGNYKVVYFGMPFEAINHSPLRYIQKWDVMRRILTFFGERLPGIEETESTRPTRVINTLYTLSLSPNPFSERTTIRFPLPVTNNAQLNIYNLSGALIKTIKVSGSSINWDGTDQNSQKLTNGIYFCELKTPQGSLIQKAVILR